MMDAPSPTRDPAGQALDVLIERFHAGERLRVWSFLITVFGDAIVPRGGMVGLAALQEITDRIGISPGALRAALSRLAKDGWVERARHGRRSYYRLTPESAATFADAARRFYAPGPPAWTGGWSVAIAPDESGPDRERRETALAGAGFLKLSTGVFLRPQTEPGTDKETDTGNDPQAGGSDLFTLRTDTAEPPGWVRETLSDAEVGAAYAALCETLAPLAGSLGNEGSLPPLDAMVARALLIHDWRRIVLRDKDLPEKIRPDGWPGDATRALVRALYASLLEPSERWLDACDGRPDGPLPPAGPELRARFR